MLAKHKQTVSPSRLAALVADLEAVPRLMQEALLVDEEAKRIAAQFTEASSCLYLGRGTGFPVALEGALKLKEIAYVDANGYAAGELKHGPIALIVPGLPVVVVATEGPQNDKLASNVQEVRARGGRVLAVVTKGDDRMRGLADEVLEVPAVDPLLAPMLSVVPLQLLSYHIALSRGCDVDQPRNLAKSVTVE
jgi:glucosamine--fructose-6-phosphate aminotransferase (isomerizing)